MIGLAWWWPLFPCPIHLSDKGPCSASRYSFLPPHQYFYRDTISRRIAIQAKEDPSPMRWDYQPSITWSRGNYYYYYCHYYNQKSFFNLVFLQSWHQASTGHLRQDEGTLILFLFYLVNWTFCWDLLSHYSIKTIKTFIVNMKYKTYKNEWGYKLFKNK